MSVGGMPGVTRLADESAKAPAADSLGRPAEPAERLLENRLNTSLESPVPNGQAGGCPGASSVVPSSVIHELRTPLTAIHGYTQILQRSLADHPTAGRALRVMLSETTRLSAMLNQLSEAAELAACDVPSAEVNIDVAELVGVVVDELGRHGTRHSIEIHGEAHVTCDPRRLTQAVGHVLANALSYSPDGAPVTVQIEQLPDAAHIIVTDVGIGIPDDDVDRIYERYGRGQNARRAGVRGLGLGLYLAREALASQGGRIWHESQAAGGTRFHLLIPEHFVAESRAEQDAPG